MTTERAREQFLLAIRRIQYIHSAISLLEWDQRTIMPPKGREFLSCDRRSATGGRKA